MTYYKILKNGKSNHGGNLTWSLPKGDGAPGEWHEVTPPLEPCSHGLHLATEIGAWMQWGADIYEAEAAGEIIPCDGHKVCVQKARLLRKVEAPDYWRTVQDFVSSIPQTPWFSNGTCTPEWRVFDTWSAAWNAARGAARGAARDAATDAAWIAAGDAARNAAQDAAWNAARDTAWNAAWGAAWGAASDAARNAAWNAAGDAALLSQCIVAWNNPTESNTQYAIKRWKVWQSGYGMLCDIEGVFYVYRRP